MVIEENIPLAPLSTFNIGGKADFFARVSSLEDLYEVVAFANERKIPFFVLGEGSNILVSDKGFRGLVIKMDILGVEFTNNADEVGVLFGAGEHWDYIVGLTVEKELHGFENLSAIPGSAGAAPVQNIGAYGAEIAPTIVWVEALDTTTGKLRELTAAECKFAYRDSIFKSKAGARFIITRIASKLRYGGKPDASYKDVAEYFKQHHTKKISIASLREAVIDIRTKKLPDLKTIGTAGSFFKNPVISKAAYEKLLAQFPDLPFFPAGRSYVKIPLGYVIDKLCGLKGALRRHVGVHDKQALVLVNFGGGTSRDVRALADEISEAVFSKIGIRPEWEVQTVGEES